MGRYASDTGGGDFTPAPAGTHIAICVGVTDLGTHHGEYKGEPNVRNQVLVTWELPDESFDTPDGPKPYIASKFYTNSLSEKANLRADLIAWRGRDFTSEELRKFDLQAILGKPCMINIVHEESGGKTRAKVKAVMAVAKGTKVEPPVNTPRAFWIDVDNWDAEGFEALPRGIKSLIEKSDEWRSLHDPSFGKKAKQPAMAGAVEDDDPDMPF